MDQTHTDKRAVLAGHHFFRGAAPGVIERLAAHARVTSYPPNRLLFRKGDDGVGLMAVLSGIVKISVPSPDGREIVLNLIGPNEVFGEIALLDGEPRTADAATVTRCQLLTLDRRDFVRVLTEEPSLAIRLLAVISHRLRRTSEQVEDMTFADPPTRLARALLRLAEMQNVANDARPRIAITQKELGRTIGLSRESTNRHLRDWAEAGHISLQTGACTIENRAYLDALLANPKP